MNVSFRVASQERHSPAAATHAPRLLTSLQGLQQRRCRPVEVKLWRRKDGMKETNLTSFSLSGFLYDAACALAKPSHPVERNSSPRLVLLPRSGRPPHPRAPPPPRPARPNPRPRQRGLQLPANPTACSRPRASAPGLPLRSGPPPRSQSPPRVTAKLLFGGRGGAMQAFGRLGRCQKGGGASQLEGGDDPELDPSSARGRRHGARGASNARWRMGLPVRDKRWMAITTSIVRSSGDVAPRAVEARRRSGGSRSGDDEEERFRTEGLGAGRGRRGRRRASESMVGKVQAVGAVQKWTMLVLGWCGSDLSRVPALRECECDPARRWRSRVRTTPTDSVAVKRCPLLERGMGAAKTDLLTCKSRTR